MVLASPIGQAMSDADRAALAQVLETTDPRDVQGWLGEQIRKAASVAKGDFDGHPFRGNQWADSSGAGRGGAGASPKPKARAARDRGKPQFTTMFSDKGNKAVEAAFAKWSKTADFSRDPSELTLEFMKVLEGKVEGKHKEALDTAVREEVREKVDAIRDKEGHDSPQRREDERRAKEVGRRARAAEYRRIQAEREAQDRQRRIDSGEVRQLKDEDLDEGLTGKARSAYSAAMKRTLNAVEEANKTIQAIRVMSGKIGRDKMGDEKTQEIMFALDEAQESIDRIEDFARENKTATIGGALRMNQLGVNEAETAKNAMRNALRVLERPWPERRGDTRPSRRIDEPDGVSAVQSAMDSDWGLNWNKIDTSELSDL